MGGEGEGGGGDRLAMALVLFVGHHEVDGKLGEFFREHRAGPLDDDIAAGAGGDATHDEQAPVIVESGEVGEGVAERDADGLVDQAGPGVAVAHQPLQFLQLLR